MFTSVRMVRQRWLWRSPRLGVLPPECRGAFTVHRDDRLWQHLLSPSPSRTFYFWVTFLLKKANNSRRGVVGRGKGPWLLLAARAHPLPPPCTANALMLFFGCGGVIFF